MLRKDIFIKVLVTFLRLLALKDDKRCLKTLLNLKNSPMDISSKNAMRSEFFA